jgi:hypothetical protein
MFVFNGLKYFALNKFTGTKRQWEMLFLFIWFVFIGLKYFASRKFSVMKWQRGKLFERSEFFPSNGMELNL